MASLLDFVYLDLPRLESFGSQLIEGGLPESQTVAKTKESSAEADVEGGLPFLVKGSAGTRGVLSASSTVSSRYHHRLVVEVLRQLERQGFLADAADGMIQDGSFLLFEGDLQIVDPAMVSRYLGSSQDLKAAETAFSKDTEKPESTKAKRRAAHRSHAKPTVDKWPSRSQTDSLNKVLELFAGGSARVRVIRDGTTVAVGVVEREKFVEDLERIIGRHGQLFGGQWSVLAQANSKAEREPYGPDEGNVFDLIEGGGAKLLEAVGEIGGPGSVGLAITPLAIYRTISPHR